MVFTRIFLLVTWCLPVAAADEMVKMKAVYVTPSDFYVECRYDLKTDEIKEIRVTSVMPQSHAAEIGLRAGDRLTAINGAPVVGQKRSEIFRSGKVSVRGDVTFVGRRGFFRKEWSITVKVAPKEEKKEPNKSPEPTPGLSRFPQGSAISNLVAGVAHL